MATHETADFLAGVIEGFYGQPWSQAERLELFDWMADWGLNTYLYAPKDDLKHRALWREAYSASEAETLGEIIQACKKLNIRFIYALSPGLDIRYSNDSELDCLRKRFEQMLTSRCENFALLFDDIPDRMDAEDLKRWGSFASAQCHVVNAMFRWTRERCPDGRFLFCPTPSCGRMAERKLGGEDYLPTIGRELLPEIDVFWTGPEIISREITVAHVQELLIILGRKPLIWDNLHANDYDGRRFFCGPYAGRASELRGAVAGLLSNPNCEFPLNYIPLRTLAGFVHSSCQPSTINHQPTWDARKAYLTAMREWLPRFATIGQPMTLEELILFGDCYYLPHEEGAEAEALYERARGLLTRNPAEWGDEAVTFQQQAARLRELCVRMTELRHRPLFYALSRRIWELREELDLLEQYVEATRAIGRPGIPSLTSHLPGTYRGGMVARLQRLLVPQPDGTFIPARESSG
ncbi:MAG TPA: beta-N-acetylglucosaminidase domain-containing protein [Verrucomicrobiae bacterium]|nr:beta-N-acetylglucosaminidase domain-containing protein [Verrucomicrobiae bacterium]